MLPRSLARPFVIAGTVAVLALGAVSMASAAPAGVTTYRECFPDGEAGLDTICYTIHDVEKTQSTASGAAHSKEAGSMLIEYYDAEGNLLWSDKTQWHSNVIERDGQVHIYHDQTKVTFEENGMTCTNGSFGHFANGETRHLGPEWEWVCK